MACAPEKGKTAGFSSADFEVNWSPDATLFSRRCLKASASQELWLVLMLVRRCNIQHQNRGGHAGRPTNNEKKGCL